MEGSLNTYVREKPCVTCGGTEFYKSDYRCVWCKNVKYRQFSKSEAGRKYHREYMRKRRSDPDYRHQQKVNAYMREQGRGA